VETRQILRSGITASALAHLSLLALVIFFAEVHPFGAVTAETIAVDIVAPDEVADQHPTSKSGSSDSGDPSADPSATGVNTSASSAAAPSTAGAQPGASPSQAKTPQTAAPPQQQAALSQPGAAPTPQPGPDASTATSPATSPLATTPAPDPASNPAPSPALSSAPSPASLAAPIPAPAAGRQASAPPTAQSPTPVPAYVPAQPDLSIKYGVVLGLPLDLPPDKHTETYDAPAIESADLETSPIAEFRRHIKTCSTLPKEVGPADKVAIKLRVMMAPDGRLAADPQLIEGTASVKGALLMKNAMSALQSCQPYAMLPADKYNEWKVLDLSFTPQDFGGAS
jgi:hypothetical protein